MICPLWAGSSAFPQGSFETGATLGEGGMGVHMPTPWNADPCIPKPGVAPVHLLCARCGADVGYDSDKTVKEPATWRALTVHIKPPFPRTYTPLSDVRLPIGTEFCRFHLKMPLVRPRKFQDVKPPMIESRHGNGRRSFDPAIRAESESRTPRAFHIRKPVNDGLARFPATSRPTMALPTDGSTPAS